MPWKETDVVRERVKFVVLAAQEAANLSRLCRQFGVSRSTGYRWLGRYLETGSFCDLTNRSRRPRSSPSRTAVWVEDAVSELRRKWGDGARKLQLALKARGINLSEPTINRIIRRRGLIRPEDSHCKATGRFQRERPNELWQVDFKGEYPVVGGYCYPLSILDDHSRYIVGLYGLAGQTAELVDERFVETFERYGVPEEMLMDHGKPWWSTTNGYGLTWLSVKLIKQGISLTYGKIRHPQTQGKVERFHGTLKRAARYRGQPGDMEGWRQLLEEFRDHYNASRPHEALSMGVPGDSYSPSKRQYRPEPEQWEYPEGSIIKRLNSQGCLEYRRGRYFVCEALRGERVRLEEADGTVLVSYRHMYVREIDPRTGSTRARVLPVPRARVYRMS